MPLHSIDALPRAHLSERLAQALADEIRTGRIAPGARRPTELALTPPYEVSRTVVREAVSRLKSLGLVDSRQGSGVYVLEGGFTPGHFAAGSGRSRDAVVQIVEVRRGLGAEVAARAARRRRAADLRRLRQAMRAPDQAVAAGGDGVEEDVRFHRAIADAAANPFRIEALEYLDMDNAIARIEQADPAFWLEEGGQLARPLLPRTVRKPGGQRG